MLAQPCHRRAQAAWQAFALAETKAKLDEAEVITPPRRGARLIRPSIDRPSTVHRPSIDRRRRRPVRLVRFHDMAVGLGFRFQWEGLVLRRPQDELDIVRARLAHAERESAGAKRE